MQGAAQGKAVSLARYSNRPDLPMVDESSMRSWRDKTIHCSALHASLSTLGDPETPRKPNQGGKRTNPSLARKLPVSPLEMQKIVAVSEMVEVLGPSSGPTLPHSPSRWVKVSR